VIRSTYSVGPLAELVIPETVTWAMFGPSGDDLYVYLYVFSDRRTGHELITEAECRWLVQLLEKDYWDDFVPPVRLDAEACATRERAAIRVEPGKVPKQKGYVRIVSHSKENPPRWYAEMEDYGEGTEQWLWRIRMRPDSGEDDAIAWGVGVPLLLGP
jgi:hypothetical protein